MKRLPLSKEVEDMICAYADQTQDGPSMRLVMTMLVYEEIDRHVKHALEQRETTTGTSCGMTTVARLDAEKRRGERID